MAAYRDQAHEVAQLRFKITFGTAICNDCDGLRAGPGVLATCFQIRACNYDNVKEGGNPRHLRVVNTLLGGK